MSLLVDIKKTFPDFELSAQLQCDNEVLALLGASGCGKSLLLKCVAGIERPDSGQIVIDGVTVFDSSKHINFPPQKRTVGFLFQNYALFPNMTVWKNIACVIKRPPDEKARMTDEIIKAFYLDGVKNLYPRQISGGQQQRAALARILVSNPKILMLDEPFSALDSHLKWRMEQEITSVLEGFGGTAVFVSHDRGEAYRVSDKIAVMSGGKIELVGKKEDIFNSPKTLSSAMITGCKNISKAKRLGSRLIGALDWGVTLITENAVPDDVEYVGVRAHHFELTQSPSGQGENIYPCRVHRIIDEPFDKTVLFSFDAEGLVSAGVEGSSALRFEVANDKWALGKPEMLTLKVPKDKIILLTR